MLVRKTFEVDTSGRGTYDLTGHIGDIVAESGIGVGLCHVYVQHTSASLTICENADPDGELSRAPRTTPCPTTPTI